ncbi:MAG: hypothetical protein V3V31_08300 [Methylococcales bacterium]
MATMETMRAIGIAATDTIITNPVIPMTPSPRGEIPTTVIANTNAEFFRIRISTVKSGIPTIVEVADLYSNIFLMPTEGEEKLAAQCVITPMARAISCLEVDILRGKLEAYNRSNPQNNSHAPQPAKSYRFSKKQSALSITFAFKNTRFEWVESVVG